MTRRILLFLALLLPLQFAWANVAGYCRHEADPPQTRHLGHHEHQHEAGVEKQSTGTVANDTDCGTCHTTGSPVIFDASAPTVLVAMTGFVVPHADPPLPTALARAPDRPQWPRLA